MHNQAFEIKVALLGHVSVGKTTVLNALFQEQFSQVSMRRTTAAVNHFRVSFEATRDNGTNINHDNIKSSQDTLSQTTKDNNLLREQNIVKQTTFDIKIDQHLIQMRNDTQLVVVDIPGINEAYTSEKYVDYVKKSWDTYDCVIVVMDAMEGVNTEDQIKLLQLVKTNLKDSRDVPVIVLCNKVDDPDNKEIQNLVDEIRAEVERVFDVQDREKALQYILSTSQSKDACKNSKNDEKKSKNYDVPELSPAFIPISASNAFLYRAASRLPLDKFRLFKKDFIDEIGRTEFGHYKWKRFSRDQQYEQLYQIVSDPDEYNERIAVSNFDNFLSALDYFVGGEKNQTNILQMQVDLALDKISSQSHIADALNKIYDRCKVLNKPTKHIKDRFWTLYAECEIDALKRLEDSPENIRYVHKPMDELIKFASGLQKKIQDAGESNSKDDNDNAIGRMKDLVRQVCGLAIDKAYTPSSWTKPEIQTTLQGEDSEYWRWDYNKALQTSRWHNTKTSASNFDKTKHPAGNLPNHWTWNESKNKWVHTITKCEKGGKHPALPDVMVECNWSNMSPIDISMMLSSICMMTHNKYFCKYFGAEIAVMEWIKQIPSDQLDLMKVLTKGSYISGKFVPDCALLYNHVVHIKVPQSIDDHMHWGHITWMFCEFMESREIPSYRLGPCWGL